MDVFTFEIKTGDDFEYTFVFFDDDGVTPKDLTGYTFKCQIKDKFTKDLIYDITDISINDNKVTLKIPATDTTQFIDLMNDMDEYKCVYDFEIHIPNTEPQFPNGAIRSTPNKDVIIKQDITR